jgi:FkbM family methyltransferase
MGGQRKPMISYAQNGEDVLLERLFGRQADGFYVDVGANDPTDLSLTKHFYDRGWHGVNIEPVPDAFARLCAERPRDTNLNVGVAAGAGEMTFYELPDQSVLSTFSAEQAALYRAEGRQLVERPVRVLPLAEVFAAHADRAIDFLSIDVEGLEREVLAGGDWQRWRPRVVLLEATRPNTTEPMHQDWEPLLLEAGYLFAYFDGLNRFYVRAEEPALLEGFRVPVNICDNFVHFHYSKQVEALRERAADAERHMHQMFAEVTNTHAALNEARRVIDVLAGQVKQHSGRLQAAHAELGATKAELAGVRAESNARVADLQGQLANAVARFTEVSEVVERLTERMHAQHASLAWTEHALAAERALMDPFRGMGPMTVRIAHLLQGSSHRFPRLARGVKSVLRGTARLKRLVKPRAA